jgi:CheY-like chemotaxis protein
LSAANGAEALAKAREFTGQIDLVLTDLVMPQIGGFELAQQLVEERPPTRVLFMSGYVDEERTNPVEMRGIRLLHKPFDSETMLTEVRSLVPPKH